MDDLHGELGRLTATLAQADAPKPRVIDELSNMQRELGAGGRRPRFELANVRVASPCKERWDEMTGDDRVRVCNGCERPVFNLSEMTRAEAEAVLATRGITPCVRFYRRSDGTVMTTDCPTGARRSKRLAVVASTVAAGSALLAPSVARADETVIPDAVTPDAVTPAAPDPDAVVTATTRYVEGYEVMMGEMIAPQEPAHTTFEWSTWARTEYGVASKAPAVAARGMTQLVPPERTVAIDGALGADLSLAVAHDGAIRVGGWGELRTSSGPVLGGELIVGGLPPHPHSSDFDGGGNVVLRVGGNEHVLTTALGFGYSGAWSRSDPWLSSVQHVGGVRVVASMNRSLDDPRDWSVTLGLEVDPITLATGLVHLIADD